MVVVGLLIFSLAALAVTGQAIYFRLSYLWVLLLLGSWIWSLLALRGVRVRRETRTRRAQVGQTLEERFIIENASRLPRLWVLVRDRFDLPGVESSRVLTLLKAREERSYLVSTRLLRRGVYSFGPTELISGDPFGLFSTRQIMPAEDALLVYPKIFDVPAFFSPAGVLSGGEALRRRTHQITPNAAGVREYAPGDSLSRIHWVSTARRDRLMVKEFELDPLAEVWIFADAARDAHTALPYTRADLLKSFDAASRRVFLPPSTEEYMVSIVASLGRYFLRSGRAVGLVSCGQACLPSILPPDQGGRQLSKILEASALLRAEGELSILALVLAQRRHLPRGSTIVLVTPSVHRDVAVAADHLLQCGLRPMLVLIDAASFGGPEGTKSLALTISGLGLPVYQVERDADLAAALSGRGRNGRW